jgi:hypothetical protein
MSSNINDKIKEQHHKQRIEKYPLLADKDWLLNKYSEGLPQHEIGKLAGCSRMVVSSALKYYKITKRGRQRSLYIRKKTEGENNWNWKGGIYNGKKRGFSGGGWQIKLLRDEIIKERGCLCEWCGATKKIELHHILPFRFSFNNTRENLVLLCYKCHPKADCLFRELAGNYYVQAKFPGLLEQLNELKLVNGKNVEGLCQRDQT